VNYISNSVWHCSYNDKKITGKVTQLEDLAAKKEVISILLSDLKHLKRSHLFSLYKFILINFFNAKKESISTNFILSQLLDKLFKDVSLEYPIYVLKEGDRYSIILDGNRRLDRAFLTEEKDIKAKIFYMQELVDIIERHGLNT